MYLGLLTFALLIIANIFMTFAWYGHLELNKYEWFNKLNVFQVVLFSWGIALFEYIFQVPANKYGYVGNGGPFNLFELKIIQEFISLFIFMLISTFVFKSEKFAWNHVIGFFFMILAVFFIFKKW